MIVFFDMSLYYCYRLLIILLNLVEVKKVKRLVPDSANDTVSCYSGLGCSPSNALGTMSIRDCCLGQGRSFARLDQVCKPCVGKYNQ